MKNLLSIKCKDLDTFNCFYFFFETRSVFNPASYGPRALYFEVSSTSDADATEIAMEEELHSIGLDNMNYEYELH